MKSVKNNIDSYVQWHAVYSREKKLYESYLLFIESYLTHFCRKENVEYHLIENRVKTFESFYNKIFIEFNGLIDKLEEIEEKILDDKTSPIDKEKLKNLKNIYITDKNTYERAITLPNSNWKEVFETMNDIAGLRIICYLDGMVDMDAEGEALGILLMNSLSNPEVYLISTQEKLFYIEDNDKKKNDEKIKILKEAKKRYSYEDIKLIPKSSYRGFHTTIKYHDEKNNSKDLLFGDFQLSDNETPLQCEIQIRTVISHGLSEIEHNRNYKNMNFNDKIDDDHDEIKQKINRYALSLKDTDKLVSDMYKGK